MSVVTPVFNGERHLAECIESVRCQTYENWEYVIVNNCSTDRSLEIAQQYAQRDERIRVHSNAHHLNVMQNGNHALRLISKDSRYCKVLHGDDWLFPECLEKMVALAEAHPTVGIVSSYRLDEVKVGLDGLPYTQKVIRGADLCRSLLLGAPYVFGSPTSLLIRSDAIRERGTFYDERYTFGDVLACFEVLEKWDFGFVHQVLTFTRRHKGTVTHRAASRHPPGLTGLYVIKKFGPKYLSKEEYAKRLGEKLDNYYKNVVMSAIQGTVSEFWPYQRQALSELGHRFSLARLLKVCAVAAVRPIRMIRLNPRTVGIGPQ
ncbi:glycosyltransferase family 2 protein [Candidatus Nitrospira bockiana]